MSETKSEVIARIAELERSFSQTAMTRSQAAYFSRRLKELQELAAKAPEDMAASVVRSHVAVCRAKRMSRKAAYGQDPAVYYSLAIAGEAGEMGNKIVKALRNGDDSRACKKAVVSELPDVFIYGFVLANVLGIDIVDLVNKKVDVVIKRAETGYYGGPLSRKAKRAPKKARRKA